MNDMREVEIDVDVHKKIEANRRSFDESSNDILRRLLGVQIRPENHKTEKVVESEYSPWVWKGVELPHGTKLRMTYNGKSHKGAIDDGSWYVEGQKYQSPSGAASGVATTKHGDNTSLNGWLYWEVQTPNSNSWRKLSDMKNAKR